MNNMWNLIFAFSALLIYPLLGFEWSRCKNSRVLLFRQKSSRFWPVSTKICFLLSLQEFKVTVLSFLPGQLEEGWFQWSVDLCWQWRCNWPGYSLQRKPEAAVFVHKQASSYYPRHYLWCPWFPCQMSCLAGFGDGEKLIFQRFPKICYQIKRQVK
jgi:hypothetical protein